VASGSRHEKWLRGDGIKAGLINVCGFCGVLERIKRDGTGSQGMNSEGVCVGLVWRKARLSLGHAFTPAGSGC